MMLQDKLDIIEQKLNILLSASAPPPCRYTLHKWLDEWLQLYKAPNIKSITLYALDVAIRVHIKPKLPDEPLDTFNGLAIQKCLLSIPSRTRETVYDTLQAAFRAAVELKLIADNPMRGVKISAHIRKKGIALSSDETQQLLKKIVGHWLEPYFKFLLFTGCRRSEALNLHESDVDYDNKLLHIPGTKTDLSDRIIPLFDNAAGVLKATNLIDGLFFPYRPDSVSRAFKRVCRTHKLHDLRHTFATNCLRAGVPLKVVQEWLGHSSIETTADIYTHVLMETHTAEAERLNKYLNQR